MRLTVNLDDDVYALARSFARAEDCAIGTADTVRDAEAEDDRT